MMTQSPTSPVRLLLKPKEAATALAISERTLWQLTKDRAIPCLRVGRAVRYDLSALQAWIEQHRGESLDETSPHDGDRKNHT